MEYFDVESEGFNIKNPSSNPSSSGKQIFGGTDEWICKVAESEEDRKTLIEKGFQFIERVDGKSYYRKQKD